MPLTMRSLKQHATPCAMCAKPRATQGTILPAGLCVRGVVTPHRKAEGVDGRPRREESEAHACPATRRVVVVVVVVEEMVVVEVEVV